MHISTSNIKTAVIVVGLIVVYRKVAPMLGLPQLI